MSKYSHARKLLDKPSLSRLGNLTKLILTPIKIGSNWRLNHTKCQIIDSQNWQKLEFRQFENELCRFGSLYLLPACCHKY